MCQYGACSEWRNQIGLGGDAKQERERKACLFASSANQRMFARLLTTNFFCEQTRARKRTKARARDGKCAPLGTHALRTCTCVLAAAGLRARARAALEEGILRHTLIANPHQVITSLKALCKFIV